MTRTLTRARPLDRLFRTGPGPRARSLASGHVDLGGAFVSAEVEDASTVITNARVRMPRMIYGTAWKKERTKELVLLAVRQGFRGIDTACQPKHYREDLVGDALAQLYAEGTVRREDLFLQTKFTLPGGHDERAPYDLDASRSQQVQQSFAVSQKNLKTEYVDSLVLHSPAESHDATMEVWRALEKIADAGGAKQLGISNCDLGALQLLHKEARVKPSIVQNRFYKDTDYDDELRHWCASVGIRYQSFWTLTANPDLLQSPEVVQLASARGRTTEQILFRFALDEGICPLTGTSSKEHMSMDLQVLGDAPLTDAEGSVVVAKMASPRCTIL